MTRQIVAAQSGWGKSYAAQYLTVDQLEEFEYVVVADYKDEYRGLAKAGLAKWMGLGSKERNISADGWRQLIKDNPRLVVARAVGLADWRRWVATISRVAQGLPGDALVVIDEAHFVAPQETGYPEAVTELATTGRGNGVASMWITQRLQKLDETPLSQADSRLLGGFESDRDRQKIAGYIPYDVGVHEPGGQSDSLQRFKDPEGGLKGSEWIYSTTDGERRRVDTREWDMDVPHFGGEAPSLSVPD